MANGSLFLEVVYRTYHTLQHKSHGKTTTHKRPNEGASRSGQGVADAKTTTPNGPNEDASHSGQGEGTADPREVPVRLLLVIMDIRVVTSAHVR